MSRECHDLTETENQRLASNDSCFSHGDQGSERARDISVVTQLLLSQCSVQLAVKSSRAPLPTGLPFRFGASPGALKREVYPGTWPASATHVRAGPCFSCFLMCPRGPDTAGD